MLVHEAKLVAFGAAANMAVDYPAPSKTLAAAAITYLCSKPDKDAFMRKCGKYPLYARLIFLSQIPSSDFGVENFTAAHKLLFEEEQGGGEIRTGELTLTGGSCADPKLLRGSLKNVLTKMQQIPAAPQINKADFATQLCCYIRELIILSPFAFGNGVARRAFIQNFCHSRGFSLNYSLGTKEEIAAAETEAFASDAPQPLFLLLVKCLNYLQEEPAPNKSARARRPELSMPERKSAPHKPELNMPERKSVPHKPEPEIKKPTEKTERASKPAPEKPAERTQKQSAKSAASVKKSAATQPKKSPASQLNELKEIKSTLEKLTARVAELIKTYEK